jgi:hypothetical protein
LSPSGAGGPGDLVSRGHPASRRHPKDGNERGCANGGWSGPATDSEAHDRFFDGR